MNFRDIMKDAKSQGWTVEHTRKGHWKFTPPVKGVPIVYASGTPSDCRGVNQVLADLKKSGFVFDH